MRIEFKRRYLFSNDADMCEIYPYARQAVINGRQATEREYMEVLTEYFKGLADMDSWKHTWHNDFSKYQEREVRDRLKKIFEEKISSRKQEIEHLETALKALMSQPVY